MTVIRDKRSQPPPAIGQIVLWHPPRGDDTPEAWPAIIQFIGDPARGIVDLTVFMGKGPKVIPDVPYAEAPMPEHWTRMRPE